MPSGWFSTYLGGTAFANDHCATRADCGLSRPPRIAQEATPPLRTTRWTLRSLSESSSTYNIQCFFCIPWHLFMKTFTEHIMIKHPIIVKSFGIYSTRSTINGIICMKPYHSKMLSFSVPRGEAPLPMDERNEFPPLCLHTPSVWSGMHNDCLTKQQQQNTPTEITCTSNAWCVALKGWICDVSF